MKTRSIKYLCGLTLLTVSLILFGFFGFDPLIDWMGLSKGFGLFWAGILMIVISVAFIGLVFDMLVLIITKALESKRGAKHG